MKQINIDQLYDRFKNKQDGELILDIRTQEEYEEGHIPGSQNISHEQVLDHVNELKKFDKVYLYCRSGNRVGQAYVMLTQAGLNNIIGLFVGGMPNWIEKGYPVEK